MIQLSFALIDLLTEQTNVQLQRHHEYTTQKQTNKQINESTHKYPNNRPKLGGAEHTCTRQNETKKLQ